MGEKDITEKILFDNNDVFADIVNVLLFDGKEIVRPDSLTESGTISQYKADDSKVHQQERDVAKYWQDTGITLAIYGIENQTVFDRFMPFRVIGYDGASYRAQILGGYDRIVPVVTIVLYFGEEHWRGSVSLKDNLEIPDFLDPYVNDYHINVFEISWLTEEQVSKFRSSFRVVADFYVKKRIDPGYIPSDKTVIDHIDQVLKLLSVLTGDRSYEEILKEDGQEVKTMCEVAERLKNEGRIEGKIEGKIEGRAEGYKEAEEEFKEIINAKDRELVRLREEVARLTTLHAQQETTDK